MRGPAIMQPDSDSDDELPSGWEERANNDGNVFYLKYLTIFIFQF